MACLLRSCLTFHLYPFSSNSFHAFFYSNLKGLLDDKVISLTKSEYAFSGVLILHISIKVVHSASQEIVDLIILTEGILYGELRFF